MIERSLNGGANSDHPLEVEGFNGSLEELARAIGRLRYDRTAEFFKLLAAEYDRQAKGDAKRGRMLLADCLSQASDELQLTYEGFADIWYLCAPHMNEPQTMGKRPSPRRRTEAERI